MYHSGHPDQHFGQFTYSQHGEDLVIVNIFAQLGMEKPSYLDLGAHHPSRISNTKLLYERGSRGVNVEANPNLMREFYEQRPQDHNVCIGVSLEDGAAPLFMFDEYSGRNTLSQMEVEYVREHVGMEVKEAKIIQTKKLQTIVDDYCRGEFPWFLNCDIEGLDFDILASTDFLGCPAVICVEARDSKKMCDMMGTKRYYPYCQMGENIIFIKELCFRKIANYWPRLPIARENP